MESSEYVDRTLDIFFGLFERFKNVGVVLQSALYRTGADLERLIEAGARVRLVKGAYLEPASVAFQRKSDVDASFVRLMRMMLARGNYPAIATHDETITEATKRYAIEHDIGPERFEFQMLYGVRRDLQTRLVAEGYKMRIYLPYGTHWYPYLMRRMAERPANVMFVLGNVAREARSKS
jgi:proline dehydrogenase